MGRNKDHKKVKCKKCGGTGFMGKNLNNLECCPACNGNGTVKNHNCK